MGSSGVRQATDAQVQGGRSLLGTLLFRARKILNLLIVRRAGAMVQMGAYRASADARRRPECFSRGRAVGPVDEIEEPADCQRSKRRSTDGSVPSKTSSVGGQMD